MLIHIIVPVFNRLKLTQKLIFCLRNQEVNCAYRIVVVNDGSTDGSVERLSSQDALILLNGDGKLFWGGSIDLALNYVKNNSLIEDYILFINNDVNVHKDYLQNLLKAAQRFPKSAISSAIRKKDNCSQTLSLGVRIDVNRFLAYEIISDPLVEVTNDKFITVDVLSGRGTLYPLKALIDAGGMRPRLMPHYFADYELSWRVKKLGWHLCVASTANIYSEDCFGSTNRSKFYLERYFSVRSPLYLPAFLTFWWGCSNWIQRLTMPFRLLIFFIFPNLRKVKR